ncbi:plasmid partitioning protein RepB [Agrobacterium vitis]|uniref:Plasmid partitioning protein RepB n=1 Tax=Agrobacterium vitis TaxID=373 RepID=A0ABW9TLA2_AGRVI|nr:plasmid partitioning protein RepB [Agrobacterium vitis]MUO44730.1 plasmid partitioning protein RepB [Agrobacterium vitis]
MARKNLLSGLLDDADKNPPSLPISDAPPTTLRPTTRGLGALGAVTRSIDELAARADAARDLEERLAAGETIVDLDVNLIDSSFISDRVGMDETGFRELVEAIRVRGQDSPILVRPHPDRAGRFQTVFGHRRVRAAKELGISVRAVVKKLEDRDHVIAQGQENSQRADLSFIERALFARNLELGNFGRDTIMLALGADKTTVSKMLLAIERFPEDILATVTQARAPGRDRWYGIGAALGDPAIAAKARNLLSHDDYVAALPESRFEMLERLIPKEMKVSKKGSTDQEWVSPKNLIKATIKNNGSGVTIALKPFKNSGKASAFGTYLTENLDRLFTAFENDQPESGD